MKRRLSWTEKRRARMALKIDAIELLEIGNTITEPITVVGLSTGMLAGLSFLNPNQRALPNIGAPRREAAKGSTRRPSAAAPANPGGILPFAVHPRTAANSGTPAGETPRVHAPRKAATDSWLTPTSRQRRTPAESSDHGLLSTRIKPAPSATARAAQASNRGGAPASLAARGVVTPLRFPRLDEQTVPIPGILGSTSLAAAGNTALLAGASRTLPVPLVNASASASAPIGGDQGSVSSRLRFIAAAAGGIPPIDTVPPTTPLAPFTHFALCVLDYNYGSILFPGFEQCAVIGGASQGWVDLRAQVRDTTASTYSWDTTNLTQATKISGTNTYGLQFKWGTTNTAQTESAQGN
jgi:hypothetical protein